MTDLFSSPHYENQITTIYSTSLVQSVFYTMTAGNIISKISSLLKRSVIPLSMQIGYAVLIVVQILSKVNLIGYNLVMRAGIKAKLTITIYNKPKGI